MKTVTLYTDGACSGNPGPGGWGAILEYGPHRVELSGGEKSIKITRIAACLLTVFLIDLCWRKLLLVNHVKPIRNCRIMLKSAALISSSLLPAMGCDNIAFTCLLLLIAGVSHLLINIFI